ncbi:MAG: YidC/Oxa1 family membrane protein insertase, partial [Spirochaetota bacterium]
METILSPLIYGYDQAFQLFYRLSESYGLAIILLSLSVSTVMLPLFSLGETVQKQNIRRRHKLRSELNFLKDVPNKMERYYYTRRIYRLYDYHPFHLLSSLWGLFIQIPFFLSAYFYLGHYEAFENQSFLFLSNLAESDKLLFGLNILPMVMTIINIGATKFYLLANNKLEYSAKLQQYGISLL